MTDPQQAAVARAEAAAIDGLGRRFARFDEVDAYVASVIADERWVEGFPDAPLEVTVWRRSRSARFALAEVAGPDEVPAVHLPPHLWNVETVLHELAHLAAGPGAEPHGPEFAGAELELVRWFLGFHAYGALRGRFDELGVRYRPPRGPVSR